MSATRGQPMTTSTERPKLRWCNNAACATNGIRVTVTVTKCVVCAEPLRTFTDDLAESWAAMGTFS